MTAYRNFELQASHLAFRRLSVAFTIGCATAASAHGQSAPALVAATLPTGVARVRLVPFGRETPDTTTWTVEFRPGDRPGRALQVMVTTVHGRVSLDSVMFDQRTLAPIWMRTVGSITSSVTFDGDRIRGRVRMLESAPHVIDTLSPGPVYSTTMDDIVSSRLPFSPGYTTVLRFWAGVGIETDTVRVASHQGANAQIPTAHWLVELREPGIVETLWVDEETRRVVRHVYTRRRDGARTDVVVSLEPPDRR